jgi:hypothetical protein
LDYASTLRFLQNNICLLNWGNATPFGNQNARKGKSWLDALRLEIAIDDGARLQKAACQLLNKAAEGDLAAIKELADRLDGKAIQANTLTAQLDTSMPTNIQVLFIQPDPVGKPLAINSN